MRVLFLAVIIFIALWATFYGAAHQLIGPTGDQICKYGDAFCRQPGWLLGIAVALSLFALLLRVRRG